MISILGIPFDEFSSFAQGSALAPTEIRKAYSSPSTNTTSENGIELWEHDLIRDCGDIEISSPETALAEITEAVEPIIQRGDRLLSLGGDHAITFPVLRGFANSYSDLNVLHLDAHPDLYDELNGNRHSHACPFARAMEDSLIGRLVQIGIRTMNAHQQSQADRFGVEVISMRDWNRGTPLEFDGPVYLSVDLDVLEPGLAPGVSHYEPGGFSTRELIDLIQSLRVQLVGADIVELNPLRDVQGMTAMIAAKVMKEILAKMLEL